MGSKQWVEWVHGAKKTKIGSFKPKERKGEPVTKVQVFEDTVQNKTRDIYTAHDVEGRTPKEASPSEPED